MEEYRAGRLTSVSGVRRTSRLGKSPGSLLVEYPQLRVLCLLSDSAQTEAVVRAFREVDCKVAFCDADIKRGNALSQSAGARFYCHDVGDEERVKRTVADVEKVWGAIDVLVHDTSIAEVAPDCMVINVSKDGLGEAPAVRLSPDTPAHIFAAWVRFMAHPANRFGESLHISLY